MKDWVVVLMDQILILTSTTKNVKKKDVENERLEYCGYY